MNYKRHRKREKSKYIIEAVWAYKKSFKQDYYLKKEFKKEKGKFIIKQ
jgi:hypothetical protein